MMEKPFLLIHDQDQNPVLINIEEIAIVRAPRNGLILYLRGGTPVEVAREEALQVQTFLYKRAVLPNGTPAEPPDSRPGKR